MKKLILSSIIMIFLVACGKKEQEHQKDTTQAATEATTTETSQAVLDPETITINSADGSTFAVIQLQEDKAVVTYDNQNILVHRKKEDKRKHELNGTIISEIKYKDDGFKLRNSDGQLKWKVKVGEGKVKISNNEESNNAFELKVNDNGKAKIKRNDVELVEAKQKDKTVIEVQSKEGNFKIKAKEFDRGYAILGLSEIPKQERLLLLVEFLEM